MNTFSLHLFAADRGEVIEDLASFTGEDQSGGFGLLAHHDRFMTALTFGLARLRFADGRHEYLGLPGGLLYFLDNALRISTRRYLRDTDLSRLTGALSRELLEEEQALEQTRHKLHRLEAELLRRLVQLGRD
ncbi:MAG: hypothetical protein MUE86_06455 [Thiobacillaceae bacterium]|jgi:F-type H+-transporting ATPase subunit epsilon|nr:hypothetical protein [Thiobacillaceae bacterium]